MRLTIRRDESLKKQASRAECFSRADHRTRSDNPRKTDGIWPNRVMVQFFFYNARLWVRNALKFLSLQVEIGEGRRVCCKMRADLYHDIRIKRVDEISSRFEMRRVLSRRETERSEKRDEERRDETSRLRRNRKVAN